VAKIIKVTLSEYFPFQAGLSDDEKRREGGTTDRAGKPLCTLEDYLEGNAPYVSLACDTAGGPPGNVAEFKVYGYRVWLPELSESINSFIDKPVELPIMIDFRLVDTGDDFTGKTKDVEVAGREPIDVCRRAKPPEDRSLSTMLTDLWLMGPP
jgi:hypothetical protein